MLSPDWHWLLNSDHLVPLALNCGYNEVTLSFKQLQNWKDKQSNPSCIPSRQNFHHFKACSIRNKSSTWRFDVFHSARFTSSCLGQKLPAALATPVISEECCLQSSLPNVDLREMWYEIKHPMKLIKLDVCLFCFSMLKFLGRTFTDRKLSRVPMQPDLVL